MTKHIDGYKHISTVVDIANAKIDKIRKGDLVPLITSSTKEQENIGGLFPSDQMVIAARTGTGKTSKALSDITDYVDEKLNPFYKDKIIILYDSWEMPDWRNLLRMYSRASETTVRNLINFREKMSDEHFDRIKKIGETFKGLPIYFRSFSTNVAKWKEMKKHIAAMHTDKIIINLVDHIRLVLAANEKSEEALISSLMMAGIHVKNEYEMINIFLSQMNRNIETSSNRGEIGKNIPVASDIFGSDAIFQCADVVMALHRPGMYKLEKFENLYTGYDSSNPMSQDNLLLECILKQRDGWTGVMPMTHNLAHNKIVDYQENYFTKTEAEFN